MAAQYLWFRNGRSITGVAIFFVVLSNWRRRNGKNGARSYTGKHFEGYKVRHEEVSFVENKTWNWYQFPQYYCNIARVNPTSFLRGSKEREWQTSHSKEFLVGIRAALNRYLVGAPFYRKMNVVSGPEFVIANKMFDTKCKLYYKANNPKPRHKPVIEKKMWKSWALISRIITRIQ